MSNEIIKCKNCTYQNFNHGITNLSHEIKIIPTNRSCPRMEDDMVPENQVH